MWTLTCVILQPLLPATARPLLVCRCPKALVVSGSRTVNPPYGDLVLSGVSICASPDLDILGVKLDSRLTFEYHVRGIVSRVSKRIGILRLWSVSLWTPLCCFVADMHLFSQSLSFVLRCGDLLLNNVIFSYWHTRCIRWPGFALIRLSCCVIDVMLLHCVCCARLIRIWIIVCSLFNSASVRVWHIWAAAAAHPFIVWSINV